MAGIKEVEIPSTKNIEETAKVLVKSGYLAGVKKAEGTIIIELKYKGKEPVITGIERVSKPGARIYCGVKELPRVLGGLGMNILSTPKGIMTDNQAKKLNVGGEIIAKIW